MPLMPGSDLPQTNVIQGKLTLLKIALLLHQHCTHSMLNAFAMQLCNAQVARLCLQRSDVVKLVVLVIFLYWKR